MPAITNRQEVFCGPFSEEDLAAFQAAIDYIEGQFRGVLPDVVCMVVHSIASITVKFKRRFSRVSAELLHRGIPRNPDTGFSGLSPIAYSVRTISEALNTAKALGVIVDDGKGKLGINLSINASDLVQDERVMKSVMNANRHNPALRTIEGVMQWALRKAEWLLQTVGTKPEETESNNIDLAEIGSYSFSIRTNTSSKGKPFSNTVEWFMKKADELKGAILATVAVKRTALSQQRKSRRSIADLCNLFETAWRKGQHERDSTVLASRLVARDRKLLKDQVIYPARELGIDVDALAHWCAVHWDAIGATYFQKAKAYPAAPAFRWFIRCLETYQAAYTARDSLDPTGKLPDAQRVSSAALAALETKATAAIGAVSTELEDMRRQRDEALTNNAKLRAEYELPADDDPVYNRVIQQAKRKIVIGKYDDDEPAPRRKFKRLSK